MKVNLLSPGLVYIEDVVPNPDSIINEIENICEKAGPYPDSKTVAYNWDYWKDGSQTFCNQIFLPIKAFIPPSDLFYKELSYIVDTVENSLDLALEEYYKIYQLARSNIKRRENAVSILKYKEGGYLPLHQDLGVSTRVLSSVIYLNDNYEGGKINFPEVGVSLSPKAGSILLFPSNFVYAHEIEKITKGLRYCLPNFFHNTKEIRDSDGTA